MGRAFTKKAKDTFRNSRSKDTERLKEPDLNTARPEDIPTILARPVHGFTPSVDDRYEKKSLPQEGREEGREARPRGIALLSLALGHYSESSARVAGTVRILLLLIILAVGGFFLMTLREGHAWGDDFGLYILHAKKAFQLPMFAGMSGLAIIGYFTRIRQQITYFELFPVLYSIPLLILLQPIEMRYLFPLMPFYLFYAFLGIRAVSQTKERESLAFLAILIVFLVTYSAQYARLDYGPIREGVTKAESQQLFDYIRKETNEADVFAFRKPKALALFTGRRASALHQDPDDQALWKYLRQIKATHLLWGPSQLEPDYQEFLRSFITRNQDHLQETYANADFRLYKIKDL